MAEILPRVHYLDFEFVNNHTVVTKSQYIRPRLRSVFLANVNSICCWLDAHEFKYFDCVALRRAKQNLEFGTLEANYA